MTFARIKRIFHCVQKSHRAINTEPRDGKTYPVETFFNQLRELCPNDSSGIGTDRGRSKITETEQAVALARANGLLVESPQSWIEFSEGSADDSCARGTEHFVNFEESHSDVVKLTTVPGFGLTPRIRTFEVPNLREPESPTIRRQIEFERATPLEYLQRWICSNEVFEDDVRLASVVSWADGNVSFVIRQPHYGGKPAPQKVIDEHFLSCGWEKMAKEQNHTVFFNYAFGVLDDDLEAYLEIFPG